MAKTSGWRNENNVTAVKAKGQKDLKQAGQMKHQAGRFERVARIHSETWEETGSVKALGNTEM